VSAPSVSISILATFDAGTVGACLESVLALDYDGPLDVHVREQGADDEQFALLERIAAGSPPGRPVHLSRGDNVGFAPGHNIGMRATEGELMVLVNADAVLDPAFLTESLPHFDDPAVGAIQAKLVRPDDEVGPNGSQIIDTVGFLATRRRLFLPRGQGEEDTGQYDRVEEVFGADGAVPIYRRDALEDVAIPRRLGPDRAAEGVEYLDESFFIYKCDLDLAWRLQHRGWKTMYVPTARARHIRTLRRGFGGARAVLAQRRKVPVMGRSLSFCNHRLTQIKNDSARALLRDAAPWLGTEVVSWGVIFTERIGPRAVARLIRLTPQALRKRRWVQSHRRPEADPHRWFE
jgi:GT2 family glycosyltransferase